MKKFSRLMLIGTALATFAGVVVLAEKLGGTIFLWIGIALLSAFAQRRREAQKKAQKARDQGLDAKDVSVGEEQKQETSA
jgi:putative Mn2+ efflux pump MntP